MNNIQHNKSLIKKEEIRVTIDPVVDIYPRYFRHSQLQVCLEHSVTDGWTVTVSNPRGGEILRTCPDRTLGTMSARLLPGSKEAGFGVACTIHFVQRRG
jgi:hypothetical protein